jgi:ribosomal protein S6--L-glutamate ligase
VPATGATVIITSNKELRERYDDLGVGDLFIGSLSLKFLREAVLIDLRERGVDCLPSALSQVLNSSKIAQALIYKAWMISPTALISRRMDMMDAIAQFKRSGIGPVVTKQDHMHCGHGIRRWENLEHLYNHVALAESSYPFVLQPYVDNFTDVRVIIVGEYVEAYVRRNPYNFRVNLSAGGESLPHHLNSDQERFCRAAMERGQFPYAHIDLMLLENGTHFYLNEIALNGGTKGARIGRRELDRMKQELLEQLTRERR